MNKKTLLSLVLILLAIGTLLCLLYVMRKDTALGTVNPDNSSITYKSTDYGFTFSLPTSWQGYSIIKDTWTGSPLTKKDKESGPKLLVRNPRWTESIHYEDIPILIFTIPQWNAYLIEDFSISAAPIKATELARNDIYVFALPPRWDYDYSEGYQEAQTIISGNPLKTFSIITNNKSEALTPKEATYTIGTQSVTLVNGVSIVPSAPNSQSMITTRYFGNEVTHDFDGDGRADTAFLITQNTGGSGTFYYVVIALNTARGYVGSSGILLGDRIAPQTTEMSQNPSTKDVVVINYAVRKNGEPFTTKPSIGKSTWVKLDVTTMQLGEVVQNFEGESNK
jgi:hypothetical protein